MTWFTGTLSSSLIGMKRWSLKSGLPHPALVPIGLSVSKNIVPSTGELGQGVWLGGVNQTKLSGTTDFVTAYEFAKKCLPFQKEKELALILEEREEAALRNDFLRIKIAVLRLLHYGAPPEMVKQARDHITRKYLPGAQNLPPRWTEHLRLVGLPTRQVPLKLTPFGEGTETTFTPGTLIAIRSSLEQISRIGMILVNDPDRKKCEVIYSKNETAFYFDEYLFKNILSFRETPDQVALSYPPHRKQRDREADPIFSTQLSPQ